MTQHGDEGGCSDQIYQDGMAVRDRDGPLPNGTRKQKRKRRTSCVKSKRTMKGANSSMFAEPNLAIVDQRW